MDPRVGTEFAGHRIEGVIGRGGASVVYLAEHLRLGRRVALKVLAPHLADDEGFRERFIRESRTAAALDHPNIVTVYDAGEVDGSLYISMRYVEGSDLGKLLRTEKVLEPSRAIAVLSQVASALDTAHAEGLVHRDVKPGNILVDVSAGVPGLDRAYLSDFGISKRTTTRGGLTRTGQFVGTVDYVAPEQIAGQPVDGRTDVYSLGCVLYECVCGQVPFPGVTEVATIYSHLHDPPPSVVGVIDSNGGLDDVLAKALAKDKDERYDTCSALIEAARSELIAPATTMRPRPAGVGRVASGDVIDAPVGVGAREAAPPAERDVETVHLDAPAVPSASKPPRPEGHPRRRIALVSIGAVAVVIAVLAFALPRIGEQPGPTGPETPTPTGPTTPPTGGQNPGPSVRLLWPPAYPLEHVFGGAGKQAILDAVVTDDAVVAVGHAASFVGALDDAAVWRSTNGEKWNVIGEGSLAGDDDDERMIAVTEFDGALVAAGWDGSDAAVWISRDDGDTWTSSGSSALGGAGNQLIRDLVPVDSQLYAVGVSGFQGQQDAAVWVSRDGTGWERMQGAALVSSGQQEMWSARPVGSRLVVVGVTTELGDMDAAFWFFEDEAWTRVDPTGFDESGPQIALDLAGGERELPLVAVGCHDDATPCHIERSTAADAAVWTSQDGRSWRRLPAEGALEGPGHQVMRAVVSYRGSFVAVGVRSGPLGDLDGGVWTSRDALVWRDPGRQASITSALGGLGDQSLRALVRYGRSRIALFGFGVTDEGEGEDAQVWTGISLR
jgi:tRNA A-37 threonylcarbamoyl transferase component Bud32